MSDQLELCTCYSGYRCPPCGERSRAHMRFVRVNRDIRKQTHPVEWADQQTSFHDCRIALCLAMGVPLHLIHPVTGHDLSGVR